MDNQGMFYFGHSCSQAFTQSSRVTISSSLKLASQPHKLKLCLIIPSHHGIGFGSLIYQTKQKTFYGEQPVMHCLQVQNWFRNASSTIQCALYAQVTVRMFYTLCGPIRHCHKCGKKTRNGALDKLQGIPISHNLSSRYWTQHAMWNYSLQSCGQSSSEETNSDFHHWGSLWTRLCRPQLPHSWSFGKHKH